jgi:hypothetical protein
MNRRVLNYILGGILLAVVAGGAFGYWFMSTPHEITLTPAQIQKVVDAKLPLTTKKGDITISKVAIDLSGNQAAANFVMSYNRGTAVYTIAGTAAGTVRYDNQSASFYMHPTELHINDVVRNDTNVGDKVNNLIDRFSRSPEKAEARKQRLQEMADAALQTVVRVAADELFERIPVYSFKNNTTGNAARIVLNDVQVRDGKLHLFLGGDK